MMKYAMEILDREEAEDLERKKKQAEKARNDKKEPGYLAGLLGLDSGAVG